jgi:hypothetical protein
MEPAYITKKQLARRWGCSIKTVERIANDPASNLPAYDLGGVKYKLEDVLRFEEQRKRSPDESEEHQGR